MKIRNLLRTSHSALRTSGGTLMIVIVVTALVGFVLAAYLTLLSSQNVATMRSQAWNATVPVIEAGIEDALAHLNAHGKTNLGCDGWSLSGDYYWMKRYIADNYYVVTISNWVANTTNQPIVESRGYVATPPLVASADNFMLATIAAATPGKMYLGRGVRASAKPDRLFTKGMVADGRIDLLGNNITSDSFDSSDTNYNTNGRYDASKRKAGGDIATNSGLTNSMDTGNAQIYGKVSTGPGGIVKMGPNGSVGDFAWQSDPQSKGNIQPGYSADDMNIDFIEVEPPFTGGYSSPTSGDVNGTNYNYVLTSGNWQMSQLVLSGSEKLIVTGDAILYVTGSVSISGSAYIEIAPGARLQLYVEGPTASLGGNGVMNQTGNSTNFIYYGMPGNTDVSFSGNSAFTGLIYAPNAVLTLGGGGNNTYDFSGASITKQVNMNGHFNFHYDEALKKWGPIRAYVLTTWNEMTPQEVANLPYSVSYQIQNQ